LEYSENVKNILEKATDIALSMNSRCIEVSHVLFAAMEKDYVRSAIREARANPEQVEAELKTDCETQIKLSEKTLQRYKAAGIPRTIGPSPQLQSILLEAAMYARSKELGLTENIEFSHIALAIIVHAASGVYHEWFGSIGSPLSDKLIEKLMAEEAKKMGISVKSLRFENRRQPPQNPKKKEANTNQESELKDSPFCTDLLQAAVKDDKAFIGREEELDALIQCLLRKDKPNAILAGPPGVGKTDIVRGLAKRIIEENVPEQLIGVSLFSVDIAGMLAGSELRGAFEKRLKETIEIACKEDRPILFIDEIHMVLGAGKTTDSAMDAANILKPYLTDGKIRVVGATTEDEYRKHVENDSAFMRRFQKIAVSEPSPVDAEAILCGLLPSYESFHTLKINKGAVKSAVNLSVRYMHDRFLPDKAIDVLDQTCARVKMSKGKKVTEDDIAKTISKLCKIPVQNMQADELSKVKTLDKKLKSQVFGQDKAIDTLTEAVQMAKAGLNDESKPIGSFLFVGPSGVGKTEVSKQLAMQLGIDFIRFDMSEYAEPHTVAKLIGSPAGYVGYEDGGLLVEQIRQHPNSVVLFDEIEKAHPDVYKIFLQIFDYGMLSDSKGRKADFRNTVIVMTSNAGNSIVEKSAIGFGKVNLPSRENTTMKAVADLMPPELRGRLSATVVFNALDDRVAHLIVKKELAQLAKKLKGKKISVSWSDAAVNELTARGISAQYGAREIQHVIDRDIKKKFVKKIISGVSNKQCLVDYHNGDFIITDVEATIPEDVVTV